MNTVSRVLLGFVLLGVLAGCAGMQQSGDGGDAMTWLKQQDDLQQGGE
ncbi:MAG TPA: hypothetical protein VLN59_02115 [Burkholderiales bacterium]|nr:hypothetical protein [Burkholderiales bacterium]